MLNNPLIRELYYRSTDNGNGELFNDPEYVEADKEFQKVLKELEKYIPINMKEILFKLDEAVSAKISVEAKYCYECGFKDGANILIAVKD